MPFEPFEVGAFLKERLRLQTESHAARKKSVDRRKADEQRAKLLKLVDVKWKHVPFYDEVSVVRLWPMLKEDAEFMQYMPSKLPKGRIPDRDYFFSKCASMFNYL